MEQTIKQILTSHKITNPKLLTELNSLYQTCLDSSKEFGRRSVILNAENQRDFWNDVEAIAWSNSWDQESEELRNTYIICKK